VGANHVSDKQNIETLIGSSEPCQERQKAESACRKAEDQTNRPRRLIRQIVLTVT
jgi:hypothetical protein